jgi:glyoxylase-like metal-dependent hydrolase (beta-lactamase superfamily II)
MFPLRRVRLPNHIRHLSAYPARTMRIVAIPNQKDNYSYLLIDRSNKAAAIDIFDVGKVEDAAQREGVEIIANLTTHYHHDHTGGNEVRILSG